MASAWDRRTPEPQQIGRIKLTLPSWQANNLVRQEQASIISQVPRETQTKRRYPASLSQPEVASRH
jgi:hypothetical protein